MKFIIADDEPIVREGLKTIIDWSGMGFTLYGEASDGSEAVTKILELNPELAILDIKMPELSGVEVAEIVRQRGYCGRIIILSGFSDFTYAQSAIRFGIEAYLLKPVDEDELISVLENVKEKMEQENIMGLYHSRGLQDRKNMLLYHILTGVISCESQDFKDFGLSLNISPFRMVLLDYAKYCDTDLADTCNYWKKLYSNNKSEFVVIDNSIVILIQGMPHIEYFSKHIMLYLNKSAKDRAQRPFVIVSDIYDDMNRSPQIYQKLKGISNRRFFYYEDNKPFFSESGEYEKDMAGADIFSPIDFTEKIYKAILDKNTLYIEETVLKLYRVLRCREFTVEQTFQILINCIIHLKETLCKTCITEFLEFNETELIDELCRCSYLSEIVHLFIHRFSLLADRIKKSDDVDITEKILNYINRHYNEDVKLEKIADMFGYNPAYLGRLLSCRLGSNFNLYIEKKRMDRAIYMLIHTDIKIPAISNDIGYNNVEYFYRKFKKYTGLTPGNFRAKHSDNENQAIG